MRPPQKPLGISRATGAIVVAAFLAMAGALLPNAARALDIKGHKDGLFAFPGIVETADGGAFIRVDYREMRDINGRDEEPERRVKGKYVSLGVRRLQEMTRLDLGAASVDAGIAGKLAGARFSVIFIHGRGGDRRLGMNDFSFGGNFNRLKNLAVLNGGVYLAPSVPSFDAAGAGLIAQLAAAVPKPVIVACGSMGSLVCYDLANRPETVEDLAGIAILGGPPANDLPGCAAVRAGLPIHFGHGSNDSVYDWQAQKTVFDAIRRTKKGYPAEFVLFETGSHGTPIRMTDWKRVLGAFMARY